MRIHRLAAKHVLIELPGRAGIVVSLVDCCVIDRRCALYSRRIAR